MTTLRIEPLTIPSAPLGSENPLPFFRDPATDRIIEVDDSLPDEKRRLLGRETGFRVLPYRMQDGYTRFRVPTTYRAIILENGFLTATFLPELGGRLISLVDKLTLRELLCRNPVVQPANLAIRNAWFAGGIEWNIGQLGHTFTTCAPLFAAAIRDENGGPGLRLYEFERCKGLFWQIDFTLPEGSPWLVAHTRILNPNGHETSTYWWTNTAVPEGRDVRVLAPANRAIYADFSGGHTAIALGELPNLPSLNGRDATYALNADFANEFFFQPDETDLPWEAALDGSGYGLLEASTPRLRYRKLFCWGSHPGGRHWQEFLVPGGSPYIEIQAGLAPTQLHGLSMPAGADWHWTQVFGAFRADAQQVHAREWETAWRSVDSTLRSRLDPAQLRGMDEACAQRSGLPAEHLLQSASGWGALEVARRAACGEAPLPASFAFPEATLGSEQTRWLVLLREGVLPEQPPATPPGEWMVQDEWRALLEDSLRDPARRNWTALLHAGVMRMEAFDAAGARAAWQESIALKPSAWAWRNLAALDDREEAVECLSRAWELDAASGWPTLALAQEYLHALCAAKLFDRAQAVFDALPAAFQANDRIQILRGRIALELGDLPSVERVMQCEYAVVREGETELTDLWFELWYRRLAEQSGQPPDEATRAEIRKLYPAPLHIDFRSVAK